MVRTLGGNMQIGNLVTWKSDVLNNKVDLEMGIVIGHFMGKTSMRNNRCVWVNFTNGQHAHRNKTLCSIDHIVLVEDIKQKRT